jgi:enoyl-CoA hydratase/carnithine racemase
MGAGWILPRLIGAANSNDLLLTGRRIDAAEALRIGLVQEVVPPGQQLETATRIAKTIASRAPLGVQATLESSRTMLHQGPDAAAEALLGQARRLMASDDAAEGLRSFLERREGVFAGK